MEGFEMVMLILIIALVGIIIVHIDGDVEKEIEYQHCGNLNGAWYCYAKE